MRKFAFIQRLIQPWQKQQESIRLFPLPCPEHQVALIPEPCGNGSYEFYCPHCRIACQPDEKPAQTSQESQQGWQPTGTLLHTLNAQKRMVGRLKATRLVLMDFDGNSKQGDTDSLKFANNLTEVTLPRMPKALPDVG